MFGLTVLFFLAIWIVITVFATNFGAKKAGKKGAFLGFMLTMGIVIAHWVIEYIQIQRTVTHLCETEGGIKVYVTPEEWRKQVGEEEWKKLTTYDTYSGLGDIEGHYKEFNGNKFYAVGKRNPRIIEYSHGEKITNYIRRIKHVLFDPKSNQILIETTKLSVAAGHWASGGSYKEWINNIESCRIRIHRETIQLLEKYSNNLTGENQ